MPPRDYKLLVRGTRYSAIPVLSLQGIHDVQLFEGTVNREKFADFIEQSVVPVLQPFNGSNPLSVVIMDNCSIHHHSSSKSDLQAVNYVVNASVQSSIQVLYMGHSRL